MGKQNWSISEVKFQLVYKLWVNFKVFLAQTILPYYSMLQNAIVLVSTRLVLIQCNFLSKGRFRRVSMVNLYTQEELNIFNEILSCKDSIKNGELVMTWFEPEINLPILNKTFPFSNNTFKNVWPIRKVYFLYRVFLKKPGCWWSYVLFY